MIANQMTSMTMTNMMMTLTIQMITMKMTIMKILIWFNTMMMLMKILATTIAVPIILTPTMVIVKGVEVNSIRVIVSKPFVGHAMNISTTVTVLIRFVEAVKIQPVMALVTYAPVKNLLATVVMENHMPAAALKKTYIVLTVVSIGMTACVSNRSAQNVANFGIIQKVVVRNKFVRIATAFWKYVNAPNCVAMIAKNRFINALANSKNSTLNFTTSTQLIFNFIKHISACKGGRK